MAAALHHGIIKSVVSGDTVIVMGVDASKGPPPEKMVSITGIAAPRLGNRSGPDQPFAWGAREYLRKETVGKRVTFQVESTANNRSFGSVFMEDGLSVASMLVTNGWAKPRSGGPEDLTEAGAAAEAAGLGMFNKADAATAVRDIKWAGTFDAAELLAAHKGVRQAAIIEQLPSGSMMRVMLLPGYHQVTLMLSGIQCAGFKRAEDGTEEAQPFAREARYFVETRLLNRDVEVLLEGIDKNGLLVGTVHHSAGNIAVELVRVGLARVVDWSSQLCSNAPQLRTAEREAKEKRLRLWKDYTPPNVGGDMAEFAGKVIEVVSGDTVIVTDPQGAERKLSLSSLRCPRMGREPEAYAAEAKEALRKMLIGKKVRVVPEYKKTFPPAEGQPAQEPRVFASVLFNNDRNAGTVQLSEGLATLGMGGRGDERSVHYETMVEALEAAQAAKKGVHSTGEPPKTTITDLTKPEARDRAKRFLSALQRQGRTRGIVQFIPNGTRFKLLIPKENCVVSFACVGMRCPMCARRDTGVAGEPFGDEALAFARNLCFQRDVDIEVETMDKNGNFLGSLFLVDKRNYGVLLIEAGLAKLVQPMADRSACAAEYNVAESAAKKAGIKIWENYSAEEEEAARAAAALTLEAEADPTPDEDKQTVELEVTEIVNGAHFYAQVAGDTAPAALQEQLKKSVKANGIAPFEPKAGHYCCAKFTQDDEWYRAKVTSRAGSEYSVFFIDYGNSDVVPVSRLKPLDPTLGPKELSPQALECKLAYLVAAPPTDGAHGEDAAHALGDAAWGKRMLARVEERHGDLLLVSLTIGGSDINEELVSSGLLRVGKDAPKRAAPLVAKLRAKEATAKTERHGMWRFGDVDDDDDAMEFGMNRQKAEAAKANGNGAAPNAWGKK